MLQLHRRSQVGRLVGGARLDDLCNCATLTMIEPNAAGNIDGWDDGQVGTQLAVCAGCEKRQQQQQGKTEKQKRIRNRSNRRCRILHGSYIYDSWLLLSLTGAR